MSCTCCSVLTLIQGQDQGHEPHEFWIRSTLRSVSSQDMNLGCELTSDSEARDQYKISLGPDFRYQTRVTCHVTSKLTKRAVKLKFNGVERRTVRLCDLGRTRWDLPNDISFKVTCLPKFEIQSNLLSVSSQVMDHQWELTSDSETRDHYEVSLSSPDRISIIGHVSGVTWLCSWRERPPQSNTIEPKDYIWFG